MLQKSNDSRLYKGIKFVADYGPMAAVQKLIEVTENYCMQYGNDSEGRIKRKLLWWPARGLHCLIDNGFCFTCRRIMAKVFHVSYRIIDPSHGKIDFDRIAPEIERARDYIGYTQFIEQQQWIKYSGENKDFVPIATTDFQWKDKVTRLIAWYLPQYYQIETNNIYHGQGFTEWTNSSQTMPQFTGHYQPHIPYDVGYYDASNVETLKRQAFLAKKYGIYGFCFHWYWFSGKRVMELPPELLLAHKEIDIHFCFDWATENWTSAWDGGTNEVIFEQKIEDGDAERFMEDILPFMRDERYIKIDGRPVLAIYRCDMFPKDKFLQMISRMRGVAKEAGFPDLYIMLTNRAFEGDVSEWGMDALVEFAPCFVYPLCGRYSVTGYQSPILKADLFDITPFINNKLYLKTYKSEKVFRSAMTGFDNTPRRATTGSQIIMNLTPENYGLWLKDIIAETQATHTEEENLVFINNWNEWAEGSHLEPDVRYGYAYLKATREALEAVPPLDTGVVARHLLANKEKGIINNHFYIHCIESMGDIIASEPVVRYLKQLDGQAKIHWIVKRPYRDLVQYNPDIDYVEVVDYLAQSIDLCNALEKNEENIIIDLHFNKRCCSQTLQLHKNLRNPQVTETTYLYYGSLLASFCLSAGIPPITDGPKFHFRNDIVLPQGIPDDYIVCHCRSAETIKDWTDEKWNQLANDLLKDGIHIVEIGIDPVIHCQNEKYHDMTAVRDLQVIAAIIKNAKCFLGIDSGFAHFANSLDIYGILIFGNYKNFKRPQMYTGKYANGENASIIYADNGRAENVSAEQVYCAIKNRIE